MAELIFQPLEAYDEHWMALAIEQAKEAAALGEVPVGAVAVRDQVLIASGHNQLITTHDPTAHAEIQAIRQACIHQSNYRLEQTTLYVTLEPCTMCLGAIIHSRVERLVFAALEPRAGAIESAAAVDLAPLNHHLFYSKGVCSEASAHLLQSFFKTKRSRKGH